MVCVDLKKKWFRQLTHDFSTPTSRTGQENRFAVQKINIALIYCSIPDQCTIPDNIALIPDRFSQKSNFFL